MNPRQQEATYVLPWIYRGWLQTGVLVAVAAWFLVLLVREPSQNLALYATGALLLALGVYGYGSWFTRRVEIDDEGISARQAHGSSIRVTWDEVVVIHEHQAAIARVLSLFTGNPKETITLTSAARGYDEIRDFIDGKRTDAILAGPVKLERIGYVGRSPRLRGVHTGWPNET